MRSIDKFSKIYFCRKPVDFRLYISGLSVLVQTEIQISPFADALFVFHNRDRTQIRFLYWDKTGFALWMKKLEKDRFPKIPQCISLKAIELSERELHWLLDGNSSF